MNPDVFIAEVEKQRKLLEISRSELAEVVGWSVRTQQRKFKDPGKITLDEADRITSYLGIRG